MAKLYWRIKRNDKWTWVAATIDNSRMDKSLVIPVYYDPTQFESNDDEIVEKPEVYTDGE